MTDCYPVKNYSVQSIVYTEALHCVRKSFPVGVAVNNINHQSVFHEKHRASKKVAVQLTLYSKERCLFVIRLWKSLFRDLLMAALRFSGSCTNLHLSPA